MKRVFHGSDGTVKRIKFRRLLLIALIPLFCIFFALGMLNLSTFHVFGADLTKQFSNFLQYGELSSLNGLTGYYITGFAHQGTGDNFGTADESSSAVIPAQYKGYPILGIADGVFSGHNELYCISFARLNGSGSEEERSAYERLPAELKTLGTAISTLGEGCFENCGNLVSIRLPGSVTELGNDCFRSDTKLETVRSTGTDGNDYDSMEGLRYLKRIGAKCFRMGAGVLDNVVLPDYPAGADKTQYYPQGTGLETIADTGFYVTKGMYQASVTTNVNGTSQTGFLSIPESCTNILETAFYGMNAKIYLQGGPGTYEYYPFGYSVNLGPAGGTNNQGKYFPPNIYWNTTDKSVYGTFTLNKVTFNFNKEKGIIGCPVTADGAASRASGIGNVVIPNSVTVDGQVYSLANGKLKGIAPGMFSHTNVTGIAFHPDWSDKLTAMPTAFADSSTSLTTIYNVPDSITKIDAMCFYGAKALAHVTTTSTTTVTSGGAAWENYSAKTNIGFGSWTGMANDTTIIMPLNCKSIGFWSFNGCAATQVIIPAAGKAEDFLISQAAFVNSGSLNTIYLPQFDDDGKKALPSAILNVPGRPEEKDSWYSESYPWGATATKHTYYGASDIDLGAGTLKDDIWTFQLNGDGTLTIIGCDYDSLSEGQKTKLDSFPTEADVGGAVRKVTAIGHPYGGNYNIFSSDASNNRALTFTGGITIPEGIKTIRYGAFIDVTIGESVDSNGAVVKAAIADTNGDIDKDVKTFIRLSLPSTLESIEERAFSGGSVYGIVQFPTGLKNLGPLCFGSAKFANATIVFPGEIEQVSGTAFQGSNCPNLKTVYYLQYQTQESDNVFSRQNGQYLRVDGDNAPSRAGTAGLQRAGSDPVVRYMDDFTPYIYEIGRTDENNKLPDVNSQTEVDEYLAGFKAVVLHRGEHLASGAEVPYDRPYEDAVYAHPVPQYNNSGKITGYNADIRFGVRMLLQEEQIYDVQLVPSQTAGDGGISGLGTLYKTSRNGDDPKIPANEFYNVILSGVNSEGTYIFRILYVNKPLVTALKENGSSDYDETNRFVYHYTIDVDMLAEATFKHAVVESVVGDLPSNMSSDSDGNALVTSVERVYAQNPSYQNEVIITETKQVLGSGIKLPTGTVFEHPSAEFIGWTTSYAIGSKIWTDYPDETEAIKNLDGTPMLDKGVPVTRQLFWRADGSNTDPFMVYVSDLDENVQVTFYSVFRLKVNKTKGYSWTYSEDPYPDNGGQKFVLPTSPVAAGKLSLFHISDGQVHLESVLDFGDAAFLRAFDSSINAQTHAGDYVLLNGDLTDSFGGKDATKPESEFTTWKNGLTDHYTVSEFDVKQLTINIEAQEKEITYGDYVYAGGAVEGNTIEDYLASSLAADTAHITYTLNGAHNGLPEGQSADDAFSVTVNNKVGDRPHVADTESGNSNRPALTYTVTPRGMSDKSAVSDYTFTGTTENVSITVLPRKISVDVAMRRDTQADNLDGDPSWNAMTAQIESDGSNKQFYSWVYYGGAKKGSETVGREGATIGLAGTQPAGGGVIEADGTLSYAYRFVTKGSGSGVDGGYVDVGESVYNVGEYYLGIYITENVGGKTYNNKDYVVDVINNVSAAGSTFTGATEGYNFYIGPRVEITKAQLTAPTITPTYYGLIDDLNASENLWSWLVAGTDDGKFATVATTGQDGFTAPDVEKSGNLGLPTLDTTDKAYGTYWDAKTYNVTLTLPEAIAKNYEWAGTGANSVTVSFEVKKAELKISVSKTSSRYDGTEKDGVTGNLSIVNGHGLATFIPLFSGETKDQYDETAYTRDGQTFRGALTDAGVYVFRFTLKNNGLENFIITSPGENTDTDSGDNVWSIATDGSYAEINYTIHKAEMKIEAKPDTTGSLTAYYDGEDHVSDSVFTPKFFNDNFAMSNNVAGESYLLQYLYDYDNAGAMREYGFRVTYRLASVSDGIGDPSAVNVGEYKMVISMYGVTALNNVVFIKPEGFTLNAAGTELVSENAIVVINKADIELTLTDRAKTQRASDDNTELEAANYLVYRGSAYQDSDVWKFGVVENHGEFLLNNTQYTVSYTVNESETSSVLNGGTYTIKVTIPAENAANYNVITADYPYTATTDGDTVITWTGAFTVYRAQIALLDLTTVFYNGTEQGADVRLSNISGTDPLPTKYEATYTLGKEAVEQPINAGKYTLKVELTDATEKQNFVFVKSVSNGDVVIAPDKASLTDTYEITPATVNPELDVNSTIEYDGKSHEGKVNFTNALVVGGVTPSKKGDLTSDFEYDVEIVYSGTIKDNDDYSARGTYTVTVKLKEGGNFSFGKSGENYSYTYTLSYSIVAKEIVSDDVADIEDKVYNGSSLTPEDLLVEVLLGTDPATAKTKLTKGTDYTITHTADVNAYTENVQTTVTVTITGQGNFSGTVTKEFRIKPAVVSVTAGDGVAAGGTITESYNKNGHTVTPVFENTSGTTVVPEYTSAGTYYKVSYSGGGLVGGALPTNVGEYTVTVTLAEYGNFIYDNNDETGTLTKTFTLVIGKAALTLNIAEAFANESAFKNSFVYDGADWVARLNSVSLMGVIIPSATDYSVAFYAGASKGSAVGESSVINAGTYCLVFSYGADISQNYNVTGVVVNGTEVRLAQGTNYTVGTDGAITVTFEVQKADVSLNALANKTYTGDNIDADIAFTNTSGTRVVPTHFGISYGADVKQPLNAGTYTVTVTLTGDDATNFNLAGNTAQFIVDPATVTPSLTVGSTINYDGTAHQAGVNFTNSDKSDVTPKVLKDGSHEDDFEYEIAYDYNGFSSNHLFTDVGAYTVTITLKDKGNFCFGKSGSVYNYQATRSYSIVARDIAGATVYEGEKAWVNEHEVTYTGSSLTPSILLKYVLTGEAETDIDASNYTITHSDDINAFTGTEPNVVTITISGQNNFKGTKTITFKIVPAKVSVKAGEVEPEGDITESYNRNAHTVTPSFTNMSDTTVVPQFSSDNRYYEVTYQKADEDPKTAAPTDAGTYTVTVKLAEHGNFVYNTDDAYTKTFTLTITPAKLTLTVSGDFAKDAAFNNTFVYNGADRITALRTVSLTNEDNVVPVSSEYEVSFNLDTAPTTTVLHAGSYTFVFLLKDAAANNYVVTTVQAGTVPLTAVTHYTQDGGSIEIAFTVTPATITLNSLPDDTYTGSAIYASVTFTNTSGTGVTPDTAGYTAKYQKGDGVSSDAALDAGTYTVTVTLNGDAAKDFEFAPSGDTATGTFKVLPATVNPSLVPPQSTFTYDKKEHRAEVTFTNALGNTAVPKTLNTEYTLTYQHNGADADGFVDVGSYTVEIKLTEGGNFCFGKSGENYTYSYTLSYSIVSKSIAGAEVQGLEDGAVLTYTGDSLTPTDIKVLLELVAEEGKVTLVEGQDYSITHTADVDAFTPSGRDDAKQNVVTVRIFGQGNYGGTITLTFKIVPAVVSVVAEGEEGGKVSLEYNKNRQSLTPVFTNGKTAGVIPQFNSNAAYSGYTVTYKNNDPSDDKTYTTTDTPVNAGTYTATVTLKKNGNFIFDNNEGTGTLEKTFTFEITKANLSITIAEAFSDGDKFVGSFVYDGADYFTRLNSHSIENVAMGVTPSGSELTMNFYTGSSATTTSIKSVKNADTYCIVFAFKDAATAKNYNIQSVVANGYTLAAETDYTTDATSVTVKFTVTAAKVTVNALANKTYTGKEIKADITFTNISEGSDVLPASYSATYQMGTGAKDPNALTAGEYTVEVTLTGTDAQNFVIVANETEALTRPFTVDKAVLTVGLKQIIESYTGENHTLQAVFTNTSNTDVKPTEVGDDYTFTITSGDKPGLAYNTLIDALTYTVQITLVNKNFLFANGTKTSQELTYTITPADITLSAKGETLTKGWESVPYDPSNLLNTKLVSEDFALVGSRSSDRDGLTIAYYSCVVRGDAGSYETQEDGSYVLTKKGTYEITVQVSAPNHNTRSFQFEIVVSGENVYIVEPEEGTFTDLITAIYGSDLSPTDLRDRFLSLIENGTLSVENIPGDVGKTGERVVNWLKEYNFTVIVGNAEYNTSKSHLKVGKYTITVSLDVDGSIVFSRGEGGGFSATSLTSYYEIKPLTIEIEWGDLEHLVYSGHDQAEDIINRVLIKNKIEGDSVNFGADSVVVGTKADGGFEEGEVLNAVNVDLENAPIEYYLRIKLLNSLNESSLIGGDAGNYVFDTTGETDDHCLEKTFRLQLLDLQILLSASSSYYGDDYVSAFNYTYQSGVTFNDAMLREVLSELLKLYKGGSAEPVEDTYPAVGDYTVRATVETQDFGNYKLTFTGASATHTVNARPVTLRLASARGYYGEDVVLPTGEEAWEVVTGGSLLNIVDTDKAAFIEAISLKTTADKLTDVGDYNITQNYSSNETTRNYEITWENGTYTVDPRPIVIKITNRESVYGEPLDDDVSRAGSWTVSEPKVTEGDVLNYGRVGDDDLQITLTFSLSPTSYCNYRDGEIVAWEGYITGECANTNYQVTAWEGGAYTITPRKVQIHINDLSSAYGSANTKLGSRLSLVQGVNWTYEGIDTGSYEIRPVDMSYLTFYFGKKAIASEDGYVYVGKYPIVGAWAYGFEKSPVDYSYEVTFTGAWESSLNGTSFTDAKDSAAGVYTITNATILQEGTWNVGKAFYETSDNAYTEENGWYKMYVPNGTLARFELEGDFDVRSLTVDSFNFAGSDGDAISFTATIYVNGKPESITIIYHKPTYSGTNMPKEDEDPHLHTDHYWYVHAAGEWTMDVDVKAANHEDAHYKLTYTVAEVVVTVILDERVAAHQEVYGDYTYKTLEEGAEHYGNDIKEFALTDVLEEYVLNTNTIRAVDGFQYAYPEATLQENLNRIIEHCRVEIVDARISTSGHLEAGHYTLRLVAEDGSGFSAQFKASSSSLPFDQVDDGSGNRLWINQKALDIDWIDSANDENLTARADKEHIEETDGVITYTYSGYNYEHQPALVGIVEGDLLNAPKYNFRTSGGEARESVHDVLDGGYVIYISTDALVGTDASNYTLTSEKNIRLDVIPRAISVTLEDKNSVYGDEFAVLTAVIPDETQLGHDDTLETLALEIVHADLEEGTGVGVYDITATCPNKNYSVTFTNAKYTLNPRAVTVIVENKTSTYGEYDEDEFAATLTYRLKEGSTLASWDSEEQFLLKNGYISLTKDTGRNADTYSITGADLKDGDNYTVTFENEAGENEPATYTVNRRAITLRFDESKNKSVYGVYDDNADGFLSSDVHSIYTVVLVEGSELASWDEIGVLKIAVTKTEGRVVGSYPITGSEADDPNYIITFEGASNWEITPKAVDVVLDSQHTVYGEPLLSGASLTWSVEGIASWETRDVLGVNPFTVSTLTSMSDAKTYENAIDATWDTSNANYTVTIVKAAYTIEARPVIVVLHDKTSVYGDLDNDDFAGVIANEYHLDTESTLAPGHEIAVLGVHVSKTAGRNEGTYEITATWSNLNYAVTFRNADNTAEKAVYTITPRPVTVTVKSFLETWTGELTEETLIGKLDFDCDETVLAPWDSKATLGILLLKDLGTDVNTYAVHAENLNHNYEVTFVFLDERGENEVSELTFRIQKGFNSWLTHFTLTSINEGDMPENYMPTSKYGTPYLKFYTDAACTQEFEGTLDEMPHGTYYVQEVVDGTNNYYEIAHVHTLEVGETFFGPNRTIDIGLYVTIYASQFVALTIALIFIRRRKQKGNKGNK